MQKRGLFPAAVACLVAAVVLPASPAAATAAALDPSTFDIVGTSNLIRTQQDPGARFSVACGAGLQVVAAGQTVSAGGVGRGVSIWDGPEGAVLDGKADPFVDARADVLAVCAPSAQLAGSMLYTARFTNTTGDPRTSNTFTCPSGQTAIGGGAVSVLPGTDTRTPPHIITQLASAPVAGGNAWRVVVEDATLSDQLLMHVRCIDKPAPGEKQIRTVEEVWNFPPNGGFATGSATCPSGTNPISGGVNITDAPAQDRGIYNSEYDRPFARWDAKAWSNNPNAKLHVVVRCI